MSSAVLYRSFDLPWTVSEETERRFRKILTHSVLAALVLSIVMPFLPVTDDDAGVATEIPQRYAKLILEKKPPPPPPPKPEVKTPEPEVVEPKPVAKPEPKPEPVRVVERKPEPVKQSVEKAREKANSSGLLALKDQLADLRQHDAVASVTRTSGLSAGADPGAKTQRAIITAGAAAGSGGIATASLSRDTGGTALAGRSTTRVESPVAAAGSGRATGGGPAGADNKASRSREEIEMVFDRNKAAIYALYNRALRKDPTLQGKVVLKLTIAPSGKVVDCEVVSSELDDPELARKLVQRVKLFDFGAKDVETVTTTKPIDFLPA